MVFMSVLITEAILGWYASPFSKNFAIPKQTGIYGNFKLWYFLAQRGTFRDTN